ncbi:MAG: hypothetical protein GPJ01_18230 [Microcystis aeruginosa LL13-06]|jgi:hypothetical protein|uniref:hypothetical protein n=1 Tax=Microcystis sp. LSC13-02 TaxID=1895004 RepID=UPI00257B2007|nr:hypothetical protein [Microcystis sp. LSC13-02]NCR59580.1 hypothetical protein [Microcystis aeruginosa LL13-06]
MATDDRKRRILDHLSRSTSGADYIPKKPLPIVETPPLAAQPVAAPPPVIPSPQLTAKERKRKIMSHLSKSSQDFGEITSTTPEEKRKRQINEHLRQSQG